jgi:hypothetical protein
MKVKKNDKFNLLTKTCLYLSLLCQFVEVSLMQPKRDPRVQLAQQNDLKAKISQILMITLTELQASCTRDTIKESLFMDVNALLATIEDVAGDLDRHAKLVPIDQINPEYPIIQLLMKSLLSDSITEEEIHRGTFALSCASFKQSTRLALEMTLLMTERLL